MFRAKTSRSLVGAAWLLAGGACVVAMQTIARHVAQDMPIIQMVFFRFLFGMMFMAPWLVHVGISSVRTRMWPHYFIRAIGTLIILTCVYTALSEIPVADVAALQFTAPIFITIGAGIFLKERIGLGRWVAVIVGFLGTLLILRPGISAVSPVALLVLVGAFFNAMVMLLTKVLSRTETAGTIVFYQTLLVTIFAFPFTLWVWKTPSCEALVWMAAIGAVATIGQLCIARALTVADASAIQPVNFTRLLFAALFGYLAFGEVPDSWIWLGGAIVFAATLYAVSERRRDEPPVG
ncbi:hypothetical protein Q669_27945 [Labrenzia sp. C1B10]|uniref:DMT family transporter n=1 Tax=unclassified Labrenzia TaxID=2648686 RepID=UPI0003B907A2|nr:MULTISPECIES: DMT family transporter [unclassified Labrenzia]ERP96693.1 hypothetical protein Q669_27945 [Labrenzia sp. C1B10]ERS03550.1 hypothetical protein Q675_31250 [Labrenzia sp. C1B70]